MASSVIIGVASGVLSSLVFFVLVAFFMRPRFRVSPYISEFLEKDGTMTYRIKIINKSFFQADDIVVNLARIKPSGAPGPSKRGGVLLKNIPLKLSRDQFAYVFPYSYTDHQARYAIQIRIGDGEFVRDWQDSDGEYIILSVSGRHGLSGLKGSENHIFYSKQDIKRGRFVTGDNISVKG